MPGAALRVEVSVSRDPDHPDLGVFVKIPNGGLLPGKFRIPDVRDAQGKQLESVIVADSQTDGFGVLFAKPDNGETATVYITPQPTRRSADQHAPVSIDHFLLKKWQR